MNFNRFISTVDLHVSGEPLRIITGGLPEIKGSTQLEKRAYCMEHLDHIRKILMYEPRGHHGMYGCIITPPSSENADFGVLFMHNEGWSTMCGHGIIAVVTMVIETGQYEVDDGEREFIIDSPAGLVKATAKCKGNRVENVYFENVPSFVLKENFPVQIDGYEFEVDIAFGGAFYAILDISKINLKVSPENILEIQDWGKKIKEYIEGKIKVQHPLENDLEDIYGVIFSDEPKNKNAHLRNVTIFADRQIDRSPCGTGTSARLANLFAKNKLGIGDNFLHEGITDGIFEAKILSEVNVGSYKAVVPQVGGNAFITSFNQFVVDTDDTLPEGFLL